MNLAIFGSRSLKDERVKILILEELEALKPSKLLTCQEPQGVSEVAQHVAKEQAIPLQVHFLNFKYLRGAFERRSKEIIKEADQFLVIHDGTSKGTQNELALVVKSGKPYKYHVLEPTPYARSVGFNIKDDWDKAPDNAEDPWAGLK